MNNDRRCHIRKVDGSWEAITYDELKTRTEIDPTYRSKHFILIHGDLLEVSAEEKAQFNHDRRRQRYLNAEAVTHREFSIDCGDCDGHSFEETIPDCRVDVEAMVIKKTMLEELRKCLRLLPDDEIGLIRSIYFEGMTEREYAKITGMSKSSIHRKIAGILAKLLNLLKNTGFSGPTP